MTGGTIQKAFGAIAIVDALGASSYTDDEIQRFVNARDFALGELSEYVEDSHGSVEQASVTAFTFNDTIVLAYRSQGNSMSLKNVATFAAVLRKFLVDSMHVGLLFRGATSFGSFYADDETNTVLGEAVVDAASWYEQSEWVGIHYTPRACITLQKLIAREEDEKRWALLECDVPLKGGKSIRSFAINWPKIFSVRKLRPWNDDVKEKVKLLSMLSKHRIPIGTEEKYANTIRFFDLAMAENLKGKK